jgi:hypothetical protein
MVGKSSANRLIFPSAVWLEREMALRSKRHNALVYCLSKIFSENRYTPFRIML